LVVVWPAVEPVVPGAAVPAPAAPVPVPAVPAAPPAPAEPPVCREAIITVPSSKALRLSLVGPGVVEGVALH
jgi:hypothetical protein